MKRKTPHKMLHYGWARAAPWQMLRHTSGSQPAGGECRDVVATPASILSGHHLQTAKWARLLQYDIHSSISSTQHLHLKGGRVSVSLLLRKSIPINLQPTLFFPMHQNVDGGERRAACWWHTPTQMEFTVNKKK